MPTIVQTQLPEPSGIHVMSPNRTLIAALSLSALLSGAAHALEYPIGVPQQRAGMEIAAVYLQPVEMEPEGHMRKAVDS